MNPNPTMKVYAWEYNSALASIPEYFLDADKFYLHTITLHPF